MFEHFIFGTPSQPLDDISSRNVSPCDTSSPSLPSLPPSLDSKPTARSTVTDLASQLSELTQRSDDISSSYLYGLPSLSFEEDDDEIFLTADPNCKGKSQSAPCTPVVLSRLSPSPSGRRLQRQLNTQLQCTSAHIKSISSLVEDMVSSENQCNIVAAPAPSSTPSPAPAVLDLEAGNALQIGLDEDEGFCEGEDGDEYTMEGIMLSLRHASHPMGVRKPDASMSERYPGAIFCLPRMRKNISRRKRRMAES